MHSVLFLLVICLVACVAKPSQPPTISLESPQDGVEVSLGARVLVQSSAQDELGVVRIELWVDGRLYEAHRSEEPSGDLVFDVIQIWNASELGPHTLMVKALSADGRVSEPRSVVVNVVQRAPTPTPLPEITPTAVADDSPSLPIHQRIQQRSPGKRWSHFK